MSVLHSTRRIQIPTTTGPLIIAIHASGQWFETETERAFEDVCSAAESVHARSGQPVQVRDLDGNVLYEAYDAETRWDGA
ncbi:MAG: hypothetical protein R3B90_00940 [Planctomycetaceae bacterium]